MKLRRTRIKKETKANNTIEYSAQYKYWFWWCDFHEFYADSEVKEIYGEWAKMSKNKKFTKGTDEMARHIIDFYVRRVKHLRARSCENKVVKIDYEKYP